MKYYVFMVLAALLTGACQKSPTGHLPDKTNTTVQILTSIPTIVRTDSLQIRGRAEEYTRIFCKNAQTILEEAITDSGNFCILVPVIADRKNRLSFYAKDAYGRVSDTTYVEFTHTSNRSLIIDSQLKKYSKNSSKTIYGRAYGFNTLYCEGGASTISAPVHNGNFYLDVPLFQNQANHLKLYATDSTGYCSDTLAITIVHDNRAPRIVEATLISDSVSYNIHTPFMLRFNESLETFTATVALEGHESHLLEAQPSGQNKLFEMSYDDLKVGERWQFHLSVTDSASNGLDTTIYFKTYLQELKFNTVVACSFFSRFKPEYLVFTKDPNKVYIYDTATWKVKKQINLTYTPRHAAINPVNGNIYIADYWAHKITVVNPELGNQLKYIPLIKAGNTSYPSDRPVQIAFTANGLALITSTYNMSGMFYMQILDSNDSDALSVSDAFYDNSSFFPYSFNQNKSMIVMGGDDYLYDYQTGQFTASTAGKKLSNSVTAHQHKDKLIVWDDTGGKMINGNGTILKTIQGLSSNGSKCGFAYAEHEDEIYYISRNISNSNYELGVFDCNSGQKLTSTDMYLNYVDYLLTSPDGKYVLIKYGDYQLIVEPKTFRE